MTMIMQDPKYSLNPVMTVGRQIVEAYRAHVKAGKPRRARRRWRCWTRCRSATRRVLSLYPHELSGGMGQRAMIAMMLVTDPDS